MKTQTESIATLIQSVEQAQAQQRFDIAADIALLQEKYTKLSKRDYLQLLERFLQKYTETAQATVHAALMEKCKLGDTAAIKLYHTLQAGFAGTGNEVQIVDDIR